MLAPNAAEVGTCIAASELNYDLISIVWSSG